jgi:hypothetical protein
MTPLLAVLVRKNGADDHRQFKPGAVAPTTNPFLAAGKYSSPLHSLLRRSRYSHRKVSKMIDADASSDSYRQPARPVQMRCMLRPRSSSLGIGLSPVQFAR